MAKLLGKLKDGRELYGAELQDVEVKALNDNEIEIIGSTQSVDRDNEVLNVDGWDLKAYKKNPVVLEAHNYWEPAIARAKVRIEDKKLIFKIEFPPEGVYPRADLFKKLYKLGFMKASSVGFLPSEYKLGNGNDEPRRTYLKQELTEISLVTVPANPEALLIEKSILSAQEKGVLNEVDMASLKELVASVAKGAIVEKVIPPDAHFKSFVSPDGDFASGVKDACSLEDDQKKVVTRKNASDNKSTEENMTLKELLEKEPDVLNEYIEKCLNTKLKQVLEGNEFKEAVSSAVTEIREDKKFKVLVLGDPAEAQPKRFTLEGTDLKTAIQETARQALK